MEEIKTDISDLMHTGKKVPVSKEFIAVAAGIVLTWFMFWAYLSWDNFSLYYSRTTWASFTAESKGDGSLTEKAKAATMFVLQIMSIFLLAYAGLMFYFSHRSIYAIQLAVAVLLIVVVHASAAFEFLTT